MNSMRWVEIPSPPSDKVESLSKQLNNLHPTLVSILIDRGINTFEEAKKFFRPDRNALHDPMLMKDMNVAVELLSEALDNDHRIMLYGDYDVDGTTSVAMMFVYLSQFTKNIEFYIPDRYSEGYGISEQGMQHAITNNVKLIISLDCGIKAMNNIGLATKNGVKFIVCDHHEPGEELPPADAILDPKRADCSYPYKELSGCGVGYKLMEAFELSKNRNREGLAPYLDLLATSIAADIVPLTGENRLLAHFGMEQINTKPRPGIQALIDVSELKRKLSISDLVFRLAPRINAAGRLESGNAAVEMLVSDDLKSAKKKAVYIHELNIQRRELDALVTGEALEMLKAESGSKSKKSTVIYKPSWHKGVIGIVASRLIEKYYRPTIVLTKSNGKITGSVRSVKGFDVYKALIQCEDLLEQYGGHKYAAGLTLNEDNLEAFKERFEEVVSKSIETQSETPEINIDGELLLNAIDEGFYKILKQFGPFGPMNQRPVFKSTGLLGEQFRIVGEDHLKMVVFDPQYPEKKWSAIGFGLGKFIESIDEGVEMIVAYQVDENHWNGRTELQLIVKDIKF